MGRWLFDSCVLGRSARKTGRAARLTRIEALQGRSHHRLDHAAPLSSRSFIELTSHSRRRCRFLETMEGKWRVYDTRVRIVSLLRRFAAVSSFAGVRIIRNPM